MRVPAQLRERGGLMTSETITPSQSSDSRSLPDSRGAYGHADARPSSAAQTVERRSEAPARVGRYQIRQQLGVGGMGVVYEARDPELDRLVAIKIVRPRRSSSDDTVFQTRLLREGKAMARLSHPNVVTVYDVGLIEHAVFVAMELVEGPTLKSWLGAESRGWREILHMFVGAGRGLAAAHAAGLVHRDFKPSNVLIDAERPLIADFGLVRMGELELESVAEPHEQTPGAASALTLTREGAVLGTPLYMSPEQHSGAVVDARSDQFSFCVALWEALFAQHPFAGDTIETIVASVSSGARRTGGAPTAAPRYVRVALARGLARSPAERWDSMNTLLAQLDRRTKKIGARVAWTVTAGAAIAGVAAGYALLRGAPGAGPCADIVALLEDSWSSARGDALARSIATTTVADPREYPDMIRPALDAFATAWVERYTAECRAHARGELSDRRYEHAVRCLEDRRTSLRAVISMLESNEQRVLARGPALVARLPAIERCGEPLGLAEDALGPPDPAALRLRDALLRLDPLIAAGAVEESRAELAAMRGEVEELDDPRVTRMYFRVSADLFRALGLEDEGHAAYQRVLDECLRIEDERCAAVAASQLVWKSSDLNAAESLAYARISRIMIEKAGLEGTLTELLLDFHVVKGSGRYGAEQWRQLERVVERLEASGDDDPEQRVRILSEAARWALDAGRPSRAAAWIKMAVTRARASLGGANPALIKLSLIAARYHAAIGDFDAAIKLASDGARIAALFDPEGVDVARAMTDRAIPREQSGDFEGALADLERARRLFALHDADFERGDNGVQIENSIAVILDRLGRHEEAHRRLSAAWAAADRERVEPFGAQAIQLTLADIELHLGDARAALERYTSAGAWFAETSGQQVGHPMVLYAETGRGLAELALGEHEAALERLERCLALRSESPRAPAELALTKFGLARALWSRRAARARGRALAREAAELYGELGPGYRDELAVVQRWLADHPLRP